MADLSSPKAVARIAVVGRPNVGKSTLFNRLTGTRDALVSDLPGLTRDRREGEALIEGHAARIVDTAGLEEGRPGSIAERMREQTETAINDADLVLFLIDARTGTLPADRAFADLVRRAGKPTILVANKCEGRAGADGLYESFALGLGEPVPISAEHGEGIGALVADMRAALGWPAPERKKASKARAGDEAEEPPTTTIADRPIRVAIVGRPNAGKSTLINALLGEERLITGPEPGLTRDAIPVDFERDGVKMRLFDTAGLRRKAKVTETAEKLATSDTIRAIRFAEVVVLLLDAERFDPLRPIEHQDLTIGDLVSEEGRALIIAVNKWDVVEDKSTRLRAVREAVSQSLAQLPGVQVVPVSGLAERHLDRLIATIRTTYETWNRRVPTADLNRWLQEAMARHTPPASRGRPARLRYITQTSSRPPTFVAFSSNPAALPKSYLKYLENSLRETFRLPGVPIRLHTRKTDNPFSKR